MYVRSDIDLSQKFREMCPKYISDTNIPSIKNIFECIAIYIIALW